MGILESLKQAENIQPLYEQNGVKVVSFEDQKAAAQADLTEGFDLGTRTVNPDGTIARSRTKYAAINTDYLYLNRVKKVGTKMVVVVDYRAIREQDTGLVYLKNIPGYVFGRQDGEIVLEKIISVPDTEFVSEYTKQLKPEAMAKLIPLMREEKVTGQEDIMI